MLADISELRTTAQKSPEAEEEEGSSYSLQQQVALPCGCRRCRTYEPLQEQEEGGRASTMLLACYHKSRALFLSYEKGYWGGWSAQVMNIEIQCVCCNQLESCGKIQDACEWPAPFPFGQLDSGPSQAHSNCFEQQRQNKKSFNF
jgi:hypothetical protein